MTVNLTIPQKSKPHFVIQNQGVIIIMKEYYLLANIIVFY